MIEKKNTTHLRIKQLTGELKVQTYAAISRKVVGKTVHATIPKGNMGYDQYTVPDTSCRTYFCCFPSALANIYPWPLVPFSQISLKNSELKTAHNTFRDCRVHFFSTTFFEIAVYLWHSVVNKGFC